ncbi:DEAD/DEAH box helicase family protein [Autumnicola musiva]|uniref:DEAD/DEAH box helicase family protein n=1 Tax=Autumnicola musiva TaxID=3075589 RepID=A0ABU3D6L5_9FLAO|nr:DEAD/DEAH box helicase family protein [Zunongwangia sp. F117]MDT0677000.1 DEAD/DEAH box helicase family protein [Zunongwangia sp. F117]
MSNFSFLQKEFPAIYQEALNTETHVFKEPRYSALLSRTTLEKAIFWLYENDVDLRLPYDTKLGALMHNQDFKDILKPSMHRELDVIRLTGNNAAHGKKVNQFQALQSLKNLFRFTSFLSVYYSEENPKIPTFDEKILRYEEAEKEAFRELKKRAEKLEAELEKSKKNAFELQEKAVDNEILQLQVQEHEKKLRDRKEQRKKTQDSDKSIPPLTSEIETRKQLIDLLLKEAGWDDLKQGKDLEFEVKGMPLTTNPSGTGFVDYVLWGKNGLPLAVVEAKKTLYDAAKGKHQAFLYANCLEEIFGQRPVIFYSNGFNTHLWDNTFYPDREVQGFYTQDELQLLIDRRTSRKDIRDFKANLDIAGRPYQLEAIQRVAESFTTKKEGELVGRSRKALLVMATGSGKTRTAAAIVDMLTKSNWTKRILFLADRNALVTQAKNAFKEHLPHLSAIDLTKEKEDSGTRLVFSTYPTIMNKIDSLKSDDGRFYGVGHFDLVIIDEAHRSVYQKYGSIFDYFDSLLIGLTATPKKDIDRNTYSLFEIEDDNPTFSYELDQAVADKFLVPPKAIEVPIKFPLEGVKYKELPEKDKAHYEELFGDPTTGQVVMEEIDKGKLNSWLFNKDTVDKVLAHVMENGEKVEGGDKLGKTIIFAKNHKHAAFIEKRFNKNYPEYRGNFLRIIDNYADKAQDLLEKFCEDKTEMEPQIAVSVDMMDTGVDAPRVVNLVFFKRVRSFAKYWQMIGRGTRLRPNLFAPNKDKEHFVIFDFCSNFEFFDEFPDGITTSSSKSLSQQIFEAKLDLVVALRNKSNTSSEEDELMNQFTTNLFQTVKSLNEDRYLVRSVWEHVKKYKNREAWDNLSKGDENDIKTHLSRLPSYKDDEDELAKRFDLLVLRLHYALIAGDSSQERYIERIYNIGNRLEKKRNIPAIAAKINTVREVQDMDFWKQVSLSQVEKVREDLRSLIQFLDKESLDPVYSNFEDTVYESEIKEWDLLKGYQRGTNYKERVEAFIRKNKDHLVIDKLYRNLPITEKELLLLENFLSSGELGKDFKSHLNGDPLGKFIRKIIGLDITIANQLFSDLIQDENLNADQITFINKIIEYLNEEGTIDKKMLSSSTFDKNYERGILDIFKGDKERITKIVSIVDRVNENAGIA